MLFQLFGPVLFSAHVYGSSQLVGACSLLLPVEICLTLKMMQMNWVRLRCSWLSNAKANTKISFLLGENGFKNAYKIKSTLPEGLQLSSKILITSRIFINRFDLQEERSIGEPINLKLMGGCTNKRMNYCEIFKISDADCLVLKKLAIS